MHIIDNPPFIEHHGVKGMQWGIRRRGILQARRNVSAARGNLQKEQLRLLAGESTVENVSKVRQTYLQHPDRSTAVLTTAGEKAALALLISPIGAMSVAGISRATSKGIEVRQVKREKKK